MRSRLALPLKLAGTLAALALLAPPVAGAGPQGGPGNTGHPKLERVLQRLAEQGWGESRVIVELEEGAPPGLVKLYGGVEGLRLYTFPGQVALLNNGQLNALAHNPWVKSVHLDRSVSASMDYTTLVTGARWAPYFFGVDGTGVGVAVIDSGVTSWHDDLMGTGIGGQKVVKFIDFVGKRPKPYDDNGHGTHVAGIIAGTGYDSYGGRAGVAPGAHLVGLKVLDENGGGHISNVIAAIDWVFSNRAIYSIRVVNLSVGAAVTQSYNTDPLTVSIRKLVEAGIVVVAAAGNLGRNVAGEAQYGGITAPGNAPWVLTVGAFSHMGTLSRLDDTVAGFSSRGPTAKDYLSKPDLVAPGVGVVSLSDPASLFYTTKEPFLLWGLRATPTKPYLSLTGTSMAAPVVAGTVALMLQANPALTPNAVKAILQYTAQVGPAYDHLTQGAGFLNAFGAVHLARFFRTVQPGQRVPVHFSWSRHVIWGNHRVTGGLIMPTANAWATNVVWGATRDVDGDNIVWGTHCRSGADCDNIVWGTASRSGDNIVWGTGEPLDNVVWGVTADFGNIVWGTGGAEDNVVWGTSVDAFDNIVWGVSADEDDNIVWGTDCGGRDCDNVVWGTARQSGDDNIVWGTARSGDNIVWGTSGDCDNIVWGTSRTGDNIVWGTSSVDGVTFGSAPDASADTTTYEALFQPPPTSTSPTTTSASTGGGL